MRRTPALGYTPIGLVDDDPRKENMRLEGVRVLGTTADLPHILRDNKPDELLIALPSASGEERQRIVEIARKVGVPIKTLPGLHELIAGDFHLAAQIRAVQVEDVLGREPVEVNFGAVAAYLTDEIVLVTGAGGSIGSELCRQISRVAPRRLILVDHGETPLFEIERELLDDRNFTAAVPVLADVKSPARIAAGLRELPADGRLPRGRLQARADDGSEPARVGAEQRAGDEGRRGRRRRVRRRALRARLHRQGAQSEGGLRPVEDAL